MRSRYDPDKDLAMQPPSLAAVVTAVNDLVLRVDVAMRDDKRHFGELHR